MTNITKINFKKIRFYFIRANEWCEKHQQAIWRIFIGVLLVLSCLISVHIRYAHDEYEHIHSTWYVHQHFIPYRDFFENHHPLLWFVLNPILFLAGQTVRVLQIMRIFSFAVMLGMIGITWRIARQITKSVDQSLLTLVFLLTMNLFVFKAVLLRPDNLQILFMLIAIYFLIQHSRSNRISRMVMAGLALALSLLFLQKALVAVLAILGLLILKTWRGQLSVKSLTLFLIAFLVPIFFFLGYFWINKAWNDYWLCAWIFNKYHFKAAPLQMVLNIAYELNPDTTTMAETFFNRNNVFWLVSLLSCAYIFKRNKMLPYLRPIASLGMLLWLPVFLMRNPFGHYFVPAIPLFSIVNGFVLGEIFQKRHVSALGRLVTITLMVLIPFLEFARAGFPPANRSQRDTIQFILDNTASRDYIYDGDIRFNLFNPDLHYMWYYHSPTGWGKGLTIYNKIAQGRFDDYDICALIKSKNPRFISNHAVDMEKCQLKNKYFETGFKNIFMRQSP